MKPQFYLFFQGDCLEAMTHYANTLGGTIEQVFKNKDAPSPEERMPGSDDMVMNMSIRFGDTLVMASDNCEEMYDKPQGFRIQLEMLSRGEFDHIFDALAKDAQRIDMPPGEVFWAERFAMFTDRYGTPWMLNYEGTKAQTDGATS